jgi:hypothetical protein
MTHGLHLAKLPDDDYQQDYDCEHEHDYEQGQELSIRGRGRFDDISRLQCYYTAM